MKTEDPIRQLMLDAAERVGKGDPDIGEVARRASRLKVTRSTATIAAAFLLLAGLILPLTSLLHLERFERFKGSESPSSKYETPGSVSENATIFATGFAFGDSWSLTIASKSDAWCFTLQPPGQRNCLKRNTVLRQLQVLTSVLPEDGRPPHARTFVYGTAPLQARLVRATLKDGRSFIGTTIQVPAPPSSARFLAYLIPIGYLSPGLVEAIAANGEVIDTTMLELPSATAGGP